MSGTHHGDTVEVFAPQSQVFDPQSQVFAPQPQVFDPQPQAQAFHAATGSTWDHTFGKLGFDVCNWKRSFRKVPSLTEPAEPGTELNQSSRLSPRDDPRRSNSKC